jgi:hypothetical protein
MQIKQNKKTNRVEREKEGRTNEELYETENENILCTLFV